MSTFVEKEWFASRNTVDINGMLVYYERLDDTQTGSVAVALDKARASAMYRRATRTFEERVNKGTVSVLALQGAAPLTGGLPIVVGGRVVGGIGVSGGTGDQDEQVAAAGLATVK